MRVTLYALLAAAALLAFTMQGRPLEKWLREIKSEVDLNKQQDRIVRTHDRLTMMNTGLMVLLSAQPSLARVRVGMIHTGISPQGGSILLWDIVESAARKDHVAGEMQANQPLEQWSDYLGALLNHACIYKVVSNGITNPIAKQRMATFKMVAFMVCPIMNKKSQLLGGLFASWDAMEDVPANLDTVRASLKAAADLIGETVTPPD